MADSTMPVIRSVRAARPRILVARPVAGQFGHGPILAPAVVETGHGARRAGGGGVAGRHRADPERTPARVRRRQRRQRRRGPGPAGAADPAGDQLRRGPPRRDDRRAPRARRRGPGLRPGRGGAHVDRAGHDRDAGAAEYTFDIDWRLLPVDPDEDPLVAHTCSLGAVLAPGADDVLALLGRLRERSTITYDVNARPAVTGTGPDVVARVERMVGGRRPGQGQRRGPRGALPGAAHTPSRRPRCSSSARPRSW